MKNVYPVLKQRIPSKHRIKMIIFMKKLKYKISVKQFEEENSPAYFLAYYLIDVFYFNGFHYFVSKEEFLTDGELRSNIIYEFISLKEIQSTVF